MFHIHLMAMVAEYPINIRVTHCVIVVLFKVCQNGRKMQSFCSSFGTWLPAIRDCDDESVEWSRWYGDNNVGKRHLGGSFSMDE